MGYSWNGVSRTISLNPRSTFEAGTIFASPFQMEKQSLERRTRLLKKVMVLGYHLGKMDSLSCIPNPYIILSPQYAFKIFFLFL